tara:strand:+ start:169 stop:885 length:717 start_codon:yes stop_codon:yes gene_type:complete
VTETLDSIALRFGTDKSSKHHGYTSIYDKHFNHLRGTSVRVLELGIYKGASLNMWAEYFGPESKVYGVDRDLRLSRKMEFLPNIVRYSLDISDKPALLRFAVEYGPFDVVVDDCGHINHQMTECFNTLFPLLSPGGVYVVEDLHACYWDYAGDGCKEKQTTPLFTETIKDLTDSCIGRGKFAGTGEWGDKSRRPNPNKRGGLALGGSFGSPTTWHEENLESMHTYKSMCFFYKQGVSL